MNFLKNNFCIKYQCCIIIELKFLKELTLIKQVHQNSVIFFTIDIFLNKGFKSQSYLSIRCHDFSMMSMY